jgi:hypothetical protein
MPEAVRPDAPPHAATDGPEASEEAAAVVDTHAQRSPTLLSLGGLLLLALLLLHLLGDDHQHGAQGPLLTGLSLLLVALLARGGWQLKQRSQAQLQALGRELALARDAARQRLAENHRLQVALAQREQQMAELQERRRSGERAVLTALAPAPPLKPSPLHLPPAGQPLDLRQLLRNTVHAQGERLRGCALGLDLEPELLLYSDSACLHAVIEALLGLSMQAQPARLQLRAGLLGLDVVDIELQLRGLRAPLAAAPQLELRVLRELQGTLSVHEDEASTRWRLLIPRVLRPVATAM